MTDWQASFKQEALHSEISIETNHLSNRFVNQNHHFADTGNDRQEA